MNMIHGLSVRYAYCILRNATADADNNFKQRLFITFVYYSTWTWCIRLWQGNLKSASVGKINEN